MPRDSLIIGTRGSKLALAQATWILDSLKSLRPDISVTLKKITTSGDKLKGPLAGVGGKGFFTKEIENELLEGTIDLAVHSMKDLPTDLPHGLKIAAVPERVDASDVLICPDGLDISQLPAGGTVGTSSIRRRAQVLAYRSDLEIQELRGNLDTRLRKVKTSQYSSVIVAFAGLHRLGLQDEITQILPFSIMLPAVGQGALGLEIKEDNDGVVEMVNLLHHAESGFAVEAERAMLAELGGGCQVPVGAFGEVVEDKLRLQAVICSLDGQKVIRADRESGLGEAGALGLSVAEDLLKAGGEEILSEIVGERER